MLASWDATTRLETRGPLLWLAQNLTEAQRAAQSALDAPDTRLTDLPDALDFVVPPQVQEIGGPHGANQLNTAINQARREAARLTGVTSRRARRLLRRLAGDCEEAAKTFDRVCNDVCGEDLKGVDLSHVYLGGVTYDDATQWPPSWADRIRASSVRADGFFQVRDDE